MFCLNLSIEPKMKDVIRFV